jgi:P27 family predicted phage terminase small subunit
MPKDMTASAQKVWRHVVREVGPTGVLTAADAHVLRCYCEAVAAYERDVSLLMSAGPLITGARSRELVRNPLHQIVRDDRDAVRLLARELGLSPAARANLQLGSGVAMPDIDADIGPPPRLRVVGDVL